MNPLPQVGDIWCFTGLGAKFYYLILEYTHQDPEKWDADSVTLLSFSDWEQSLTKETVSKLKADTKRWEFIA
jgi:hypothetical protein